MIIMELLNSLTTQFVMMENDIKLLGHGSPVNWISLKITYDVAYGRIRSLSRRFQANKTLLQQYDDILQSQGIVEKVLETQL